MLRVFGATKEEQCEDDQDDQGRLFEKVNKEKQEDESSDQNLFIAAKIVVADIVHGISSTKTEPLSPSSTVTVTDQSLNSQSFSTCSTQGLSDSKESVILKQ